MREAAGILEKIIADGQGWEEAYSKLGVAYIMQERRGDAIKMFLKAIEANDDYAPAYSNLCLALAEEEEFEEAVHYGEQGLAVDPSYVPLYASLSVALKFMGKLDDAITHTRKALTLNVGDVALLTNLAALLYESGDSAEAEKTLQEILTLAPEHATAHEMLSMIKKYDSADPQVRQMEHLLNTSLPSQAKVELNFALGKAYEDQKDYAKSAEHYKAANALHRESFDYAIAQDEIFLEQIKQVFTKGFIAQHQQPQGKQPIFIVGMPRSSTSLVEQILASHPDVYGAGELNYLEHIQFKTFELSRTDYARSLGALSAEDFAKMAALYLGKLDNVWGDYIHVTDKMPQNFRYLGLIKILFPGAKIIHCVRDKRDICLSIFKTHFVGNLPFAYTEDEVVQYYALYEDIMQYWQDVLGEDIYDLQYQELVENPEPSIRALLEHCGLAWSDNCMNFHKTKRAVTTASTLQVRKPIYKSALQYWKNYAPHFDMLLK